MQERVVAAIAALTLVLVGLIGRDHAAAVAHVETSNGRLVHAEANDEGLAAHDRSTLATHLHEHAPANHVDPASCSLVAVAHQVAIATPHPIVHAIACEAQTPALAGSALVHPLAPYRLAPKTSPPIAG